MTRAVVVLLAAVSVLAVGACGTTEKPAESTAGPSPTASIAPTASTGSTASPQPGASATAVPSTLAFAAKTLDGQDFAGSSLSGRPVVLWFWAPWCTKCRAAAPDVVKAAQRVTVVGVPGLSDDRGSMRDFVAGTKTGGFTHLGDGSGEVWKRFGVTSQDVYVLLDSRGTVVHKGGLTGSALAERVATLT
jgi:thiol-disulfide isomerase/thioredoxin